MTTHNNFKGFKPPKNPKGAWLGIIQPNWKNHKIAICESFAWNECALKLCDEVAIIHVYRKTVFHHGRCLLTAQ